MLLVCEAGGCVTFFPSQVRSCSEVPRVASEVPRANTDKMLLEGGLVRSREKTGDIPVRFPFDPQSLSWSSQCSPRKPMATRFLGPG